MHTEVDVDRREVDALNLLDGAWDRVPEVAARYRVDPDELSCRLDTYVRELLAAGVEHQYGQLTAVLTGVREAGARRHA
jgi:hypothetical protein